MRASRRRGALLAACGLGASLALTSLSPFGAAAASGPAISTAALPFANPSGNPLNPGPLTLDDGRVVISPDDPRFEAEAQELLEQIETLDADARPQAPVQPGPGAPVPDPLDFDSQAPDPADYLIPPAAEAYRQGDGYRIPRPSSGGPAAGASVPGLEDFYGQQISWGPCASYDPAGGSAYDVPGTECGYLIVPVDYADPNGPTAAIGLLKLPAKNPAAKTGTVFVDPGGPGGSGMSIIASFARSGRAAALNENFDVVGFDPRGVSSSLPMIRCKSSAAFDAQREGGDKLTAEQQDRVLEHNTNECYRNTGAAFGVDGERFISQVGTVNVIRDLDVARAAVGDPKLNYLGYSYGTSIGYQYAMAFPDNIRALVLDGVVNPFENNPAELEKYREYLGSSDGGGTSQIEGFQATFEQFLKRCAAEDGFEFRGEKMPCVFGTSGDVAEMIAQYQAVSQAAWGGTTYETREPEPRAVSFNDVVQGTILTLYSERYWPYLNAALHQLRAGDGTLIMTLADAYYSRGDDGRYEFSDSAFQTIWCTDAGTPPGANDDPESQRQAKQYFYTVAPFTDPGKDPDGSQRGLEPAKDWCTYYKTQHTLPQGRSLQAMPNILYISTTYDSATPYQDGVVAAAASQGTLLTVAGANHTSFLGTSQCTTEITMAYYNTLTVPSDIPGRQGVETKDIRSNVITGDECQVHSFRPEPKIDPAQGQAGTTVDMTASGLVRNTEYAVTVPEGYALGGNTGRSIVAGTVTAAEDGTLRIPVAIPADAQPGAVEIGLVPADPAANDPTVKPVGELTVVSGGTTPGDDGTGQGGTGQGGADQGGTGQGDADQGSGEAGRSDSGRGGLATTGGELPAAFAVIGTLLLAAGTTFFLARRRARG